MKKIFITLMCIIIATGSAMAQKKFTFGPKVGVDYTHFWGKGISHDGRLNYQAGAFVEYRFSDKLSIAPEVVFAAQGSKYETTIDFPDIMWPVEVDAVNNLNYINVPIMLKFYVFQAISIDLGPQIGFNVHSDYTVKSKEKYDGLNYEGHWWDSRFFNTIDFGVGLGLTYNIASDVFVQGRYTLGLTNVFNNRISKDYGKNGKNGNAQIAIGYRF